MKRLLPTLLGLCCIADASAQLKVQSVLPHGAAPEKTAPAVYDSTANIRTGGDAAYYESLVGQRILFYPRDIHADLRPAAYFNFLAETPAVVRVDTVWLRKPRRKVRPEDFRIDTLYSDTYRPRFYKDETTAACGCTTMESHVLGRNLFPTAPETGWFTPAETIEGKTFEIIGLKTHRIQGEAFRVFRLRSEEGETLYWYAHTGKDKTNLRDEYYPVVVEGLIEKYHAAYVGREFFLTKRKPEAPGYVSGYFGLQAKTMQGEENRLNFGTELKCIDLRLIGDGTGYAVPAFVFERKEDSVRIYIPLCRYPTPFGVEGYTLGSDRAFMEELIFTPSEEVYAQRAEEARKRAEARLQQEKEQKERKAALYRKYGKATAELILEGKVRIGMTREMCREAWGSPEDINTMSGSWGVHEQWVYGTNSYLYFYTGTLASIHNLTCAGRRTRLSGGRRMQGEADRTEPMIRSDAPSRGQRPNDRTSGPGRKSRTGPADPGKRFRPGHAPGTGKTTDILRLQPRSAFRTAAALLFEPLPLAIFPGHAALRQAERIEQAHEPDTEQRNPEPHGDAALHEFDGIDDARDSQHHQYEAQELHKIGFHVNPYFG